MVGELKKKKKIFWIALVWISRKHGLRETCF